MRPLTDAEIRASLVNCSRTAAQRVRLPDDLDAVAWHDLDYLGWSDPRAPLTGHLVTETADGRVVAIALRRPAGAGRRARMCSLCTTVHSGQGVALMVAPRAGRAGRAGNTVGVDVCASFECSAYARGLLPPPAMTAVRETLSPQARVDRLRRNLDAFIRRVVRDAP